MHTKYLVIGIFVLTILIGASLGVWTAYRFDRGIETGTDKSPRDRNSQDTATKKLTFTMKGNTVTLTDGVGTYTEVPGSASVTTVRYFGNELTKDLDGDGDTDRAFLVTEETGGSGTFFYAVAVLKDGDSYRGTEALFLGDRIAPQTTESGEGLSYVVNFADRRADEPMTTPPSVGKSVRILVNPSDMTQGEWVRDFEGESQSGGKIKADVFTGTLEEVNTGCFADGECFVTVSGKHVTTIFGSHGGLNMESEGYHMELGKVQGVEGFGDLESHIGAPVEVYAHDLGDGTYTLYGSEGFYIKLLGGTNGSNSGSGTSGSSGQGIAIGEPNPSAPNGCVVGGCSGQLCVDAKAAGDMMTTCEYKEEYACYASATCERQSTGQCGWTMTPELTQCLRGAHDGGTMKLEVQ